MKKIALLTLLLINLSLSFSLPRNQASPAIFSVTQSAGTILFRHTDSTQTIIPCQSVASIVSNADPSKIVSVWVVQQGDYDKIMQFDYSVCGFSTKQEAVDSVTVWASCLYVSDSAYTTILYTNTDSATITSYDVLNSQNAPPVSPNTGDTYLVGNSPTGAWVGQAKDIAEWNGSAWVFTDGVQGDFLYNATNALTYIFRSGNWVQTTGIPALNNGNSISSGLRIGTNNARSLTFETNNVNRGRFDSVGRFYVYDTSLRKANKYLQIDSITGRLVASDISGGGGGGGGIESIVAGDNITVDDTDPLNPIVSASSSLFPNGAKLVETDRTLQADDAGYALLLSDGVQLTIPTICPLSQGQYFGISTNSATASFIQEGASSEFSVYLSYAGQEAALINEVVTYVAADVGGSTSLILLTQIAGSNDTIMTANRYFFEQSKNKIPLNGTEAGNPVTGDISYGVLDGSPKKINYENADGLEEGIILGGDGSQYDLSLKNGFVTNNMDTSYSFVATGSSSGAIIGSFNPNRGTQNYITEIDEVGNKIGFIISNNYSGATGLSGGQDFTANINDFDYTQKIYVGFRGTATLVDGTVTVATDKVKTGYKIYLSVNTPSGTQGFLSAPTGSIVDGTEFVINSTSATDDSTVNWWIAP